MPDIGPAGKFTGQGITSPDTTSGVNIDSLGGILQQLGINPASSNLSSQIGAVSGQLEKTMGQKISELRELQKAQTSGIQVANLEAKLSSLTSEITSMSTLVKEILSSGLPRNLRSPETGQFTSNPEAERQLLRMVMRAQGATAQKPIPLIEDDEVTSPFFHRMSQIRSRTRMGRVVAREMEGGLNEDYRSELEKNRRELLDSIPEKIKEHEEKLARGDEEGARMSQIEATQASNLAKEIQNVLEYGVKQQGNSLNRVMSHVGNIVATLGAANIASRVFLQEPYQFQTRPALGALGQQGEVGSMLSGALGELEQYKLGINQQALFGGAGLVGMGMSMGGPMGLLLGGAGLALGGAGLSGVAADAYLGLSGTVDEDEIMAQSLAQAVADPQRLVGNFATARPGLFAAMGAGGDREADFGYTLGPGSREGSQTGNTILDRMISLRGLGYSQEDMGALLSQTALGLRGGPGEMTTYAETAGQIGAAYGIDEGAVLSNMQTAQRYGSQNARESLMMAIGASADSEGNITSYTTNVLVPALMKVTESMAIQNLARSSGELEREVYGLRRSLVESGTNLGQLAEQNPEIMARVMNTIQSAIGASMENPAMLAYDLMSGSSFADVALKRPVVMQNKLESVLRSPHLSGVDFSDMDSVFGDPLAVSGLRYAQSITGIGDIQMLSQLLALVQGGGSLVGIDGQLSDEAKEISGAAEEDLDKRIAEIIGTDLGTLAASLATQTDEALKTSQTLVDSMIDLQEKISTFIMDEELVNLARQGMDDIVEKLGEFLGETPVPGGVTARQRGELDRVYQSGDTTRVLDQNIDAMLPAYFPHHHELIRHEAANNPAVYEGITSLVETIRESEMGGAEASDFFREGVMDLVPAIEGGDSGSTRGLYGFTDPLAALPGGAERATATSSRQTSERLSTSRDTQSTVVMLRIHGMDVSSITQIAQDAAAHFIQSNRLDYT